MPNTARDLGSILAEMRKIVNPGDYGMGTEPESIAHDDKAAWERMGELVDEAGAWVVRALRSIDAETHPEAE